VSRYYDPIIGRFLSADDVEGNLQGADPYAYVGGNPETETDPTGEFRYDPATGQASYPSIAPNVSSAVFQYNAPPLAPVSVPVVPPVKPRSLVCPCITAAPPPIVNTLNKVSNAGAAIKFGALAPKLVIDGLILRKGAATLSDAMGGFSTKLPLVDNETFWEKMGVPNTAHGSIQEQLRRTSVPVEDVAGFLGHIANLGAAIYAVADLGSQLTSGHPDVLDSLSDIAALGSLAAYYTAQALKDKYPVENLLLLSDGLALASFAFSAIDFVKQATSNEGDNNGGNSRGSGGSGGGLPPLPPTVPPLIPQPAYHQPPSPPVLVPGLNI